MAHVVKRVQVTGFTEYLRAVEEYKNSSLHLFALFTGTPNSDGNSWCGDCVKADPVVDEALKDAPECSCLITAYVGDRTTWKDRSNNFRKSDLQLTSIPTLIKIGTEKRLEEGQCSSLPLVQMMLEED